MLVQAAQKIYCDLQLKVVKCVVKNWEFSKFWPSSFLQKIVASVNKTAKTLDVDIFVLLGDYLKLLETMEGPIEHSGAEAKEKRGEDRRGEQRMGKRTGGEDKGEEKREREREERREERGKRREERGESTGERKGGEEERRRREN